MSTSVPRNVVEDFYWAYAARDIKAVAEFLDDEVRWITSGPVDILPFCVVHHGKAAVLDKVQRLVPEVFRIFSFVADAVLIDGDQAATFNRLSALRGSDDRVVSYWLAHFLRFRAGKVIENLSLIDSFDAVEQVLGHPLAVHGEASAAQAI